ncbi:amino acid adenylation domain-containing protein [Streptomyces cellulosae]|uniref:Amino acid adenylation domain-containing protein n=1 Tax=Streptomyces cellulosae TaxID=1968 RepID=A0ABW7XVH6_STRCE
MSSGRPGELSDTSTDLLEAFTESVALHSDRTAVKCRDRELTYAQLDASAAALAAAIAERTADPQQPVAILLERSVDMVVAALAVLRTGSSYVPLDPSVPPARLRIILEDARPGLVITTSDLVGRLPQGVAVLNVDVGTAAPVKPVPGTRVGPAARAYVIFTSGTTGRPKGVEVSHGNVLRLFTSSASLYGFGCDDIWSMFHSFAFDVSVWEMWGALLHGGCVVVVPNETVKDPAAFRKLLRDERVTVLSQTPTAFHQLISEDVRHADRLPLRKVVFGGEALQFSALRPWVEKYGDTGPDLVNMYGITETTVHTTYRRIAKDDIDRGTSLIGVPLPDLEIHLVDADLRPVPAGEVGEILVTGPGVALGYLGRPELTAQRFIELTGTDGRLVRGYRSGDLARLLPDGDMEYIGRTDQQVKIRGFRVELGEIETVLAAHPEVRHAVALARDTPHGEKTLVAYVVPVDAPPAEEELRAHAARSLPHYMVPAAFVTLRELPLTGNGKLDRAALADPGTAVAAPTGRGPRTLREEVLCGLFAEALGRSAVGIDEDFFQLGGHSLTAIRLVNRIRAFLGLEVRIKDLMEARTVAALGRLLHAERASVPLVPRPRGAEPPLSFAQQRVWFLQQVHGENPAYHIPHALDMTGRLDVPAMRAALNDVVARHEVLRTRYAQRDGVPYQDILDAASVRLELPVRRVPADAVDDVAREVARKTFDLASDLPLRGELLVVDEEHSVLVLVVHHIAGDGWSMEPLMRDLARAYAARQSGGAPDWEPPAVQYADFALWQREMLGDPKDPDSLAARQLAFWTEYLRDAPAELDLPTDRPRPQTASYRGDMVPVELDKELHTKLRELARDSGTTVNMVFQAAVAGLLTRVGAGTDIPIGTAIAGRTDDAVHELIGFFVNTLVTRTDTSGDPTFKELLRRVRQRNLAAFAHEDLPFERLVEMLNPVRSAARHPLFQVMLAAQDGLPDDLDMPGLTVRTRPVGNGTAKFDLSFKFGERRAADGAPRGVVGALEYNGDLFDRDTAERLRDRLVRFLHGVADDPGLTLRQIDILDPDERRRLLTEWNATDAPLPDEPSVAALVERQADRTPDAVALVQQDRTWTYRRLEERANQYAHVLRAAGAGQESVVALCMPRGPEVAAAILGVWKAGAAYLPLDPDYPRERLSFMFRDSGASLLLTDGDTAQGIALPEGTDVVDASTDARLRSAPTTRPAPVCSGRDLAYVIYTSGSTGKPKSVLIEQKGVVNRLRDVVRRFGLSPTDVSLQITSIGFEPPVREIFGPLSAGASVAFLPPEGARDPAVVLRTIRESRPTIVLCVVPSLLESLIVYGADPADFASLRLVATGGEVLRPAEAREMMDAWGCEVVNQYGPTETTMMSCIHPVGATDLEGRIPVGRPLTHTRVYVLDEALNPAPVGVPGEVYLAGVGVGRGYLGRPGLTSVRFVANPFGAPGERMYRTGDVARWRAEGTLDFVGRADDQVKIRGFRVELGEIESVLTACPGIAQAAVVVREDQPGDKRLVAYLVASDTQVAQDIGPDALRDQLAGRLPEHMIPAAFVLMEGLPLRGNGKLNRDLLPVPDVGREPLSRAPRSPREEVLCGLFAEVLGLPAVGIDDDFFALGGHSLLAARLISQVRATLGLELPMHALFEAPTVVGLAGRLGVGGGGDTALRVVLPLRSTGERPPLFCVHPGGGLSWGYAGLLRHLRPEVPVYGVQAHGLLQPDGMPSSVEEMAVRYVEEIRKVCPKGPYHLLGWSFGGIVAYEMAVLLQDAGFDVGSLTLLDCYPGVPDYYRVGDRDVLASLLDPSRPDLIPEEGSPEVANALKLLAQDTGALASLTEPQLVALLATMAHNRAIISAYQPKPFDGDVLFFMATRGRTEGAPTPDIWEEHVSGTVNWYAVDSTHTTMTQPEPLAQIGRILAQALDRTTAGHSHAGENTP